MKFRSFPVSQNGQVGSGRNNGQEQARDGQIGAHDDKHGVHRQSAGRQQPKNARGFVHQEKVEIHQDRVQARAFRDHPVSRPDHGRQSDRQTQRFDVSRTQIDRRTVMSHCLNVFSFIYAPLHFIFK